MVQVHLGVLCEVENMIKKCTKCGVEKPFSDFNKDKRTKTGLRSECNSCRKQRGRKYFQNNKEKIAEAARQYRQKNKEKLAEAQRQYNQKNKEKIAEYQSEYRQKNKEKIAERESRYYQNNKELLTEYKREYFQNNKEKIAERESRYYKNMPAGIYKITNKKTGVVYIGCSTQIPRRWRDHNRHLKKNKHDNKVLQKDYNEYGLEELEFEVIKEYPPDTPFEVLEREETKLILEHKTKGTPMYNLSIKISSIDENHLTLQKE
jgi:hypothetical protein